MNGRTPPNLVVPTGLADVSSGSFRDALSRFATGITVITTRTPDGVAVGVTATSFASLSLDPPLVQWSLRTAARLHSVFQSCDRFAISMLAVDQAGISDRFSAGVKDRFAGVDVSQGLGGLPLINGALAWLECRVEGRVPGGDHTIFVGRVQRARTFDKQPLLHWRGGYMGLDLTEKKNSEK